MVASVTVRTSAVGALAAYPKYHREERKTEKREKYRPPLPRRRVVGLTSTGDKPVGGVIEAGAQLSHADYVSRHPNVRKWAEADSKDNCAGGYHAGTTVFHDGKKDAFLPR